MEHDIGVVVWRCLTAPQRDVERKFCAVRIEVLIAAG